MTAVVSGCSEVKERLGRHTFLAPGGDEREDASQQGDGTEEPPHDDGLVEKL